MERKSVAGKSISSAARQLDMDEEDTPRHTRRRGIDISEQLVLDQPEFEGEDANDSGDRDPGIDVADEYFQELAEAQRRPRSDGDDNGDDDVQPTQGSSRQCRGDRFARTRKRSKATKDRSWIVSEPVDGSPSDGSVIPSFLGHVASRMLGGDLRSYLTCYNRSLACTTLERWYQRATPNLRDMVKRTGLSHLPSIMFKNLDAPLISAFMERWQPDTNSFHMSFGEMTILLHDVWQILRIPVHGQMISDACSAERLQAMCMMMFEVSREDGTRATAWIWLLLGSTLFVDKSGDRISSSHLQEVHGGVRGVVGLSWGSATLATLYRQLGIASRGECSGIYGFADDDQLRVSYADWIRCRDIVEPYMPDRVLRQVGYVQRILTEHIRPDTAFRPWKSLSYRLAHSSVTVDDT
ncbi:protein MAIN-LIKE 1-like [Euphorbia lathyris]|uniref:protein MAIN-LIKE 1-like n=1 Tax=Euphorbia lathyris TaxID=212925 RepID=UPI0033138882